MTLEEARKEFTAAKLAPILITTAFSLFVTAILVFDSGTLKGSPYLFPALGGLWFAAFGSSLRRLRLATELLTHLNEQTQNDPSEFP